MADSDSAGEELFEGAFAECQGELDLSLFATWLSIGVAGAFGVLSLVELSYLMRRPTIVRAPALLLVSKLIFGIAWAAFTISSLAITATGLTGPSKCSSAQSILNVISSCLALILSLCAHFKSRRPSTLLCSFLFVSLLTNVAKCQLLWTVATETQTRKISALFTASVVMQMCFLGTNSKWQPDWLSWDTDAHSPEETSSIFSLGLYSWLNSLLWKGYRNVLSLDDLYPLDQAIAAGLPEKATEDQIPQSTKRQSDWAVLMWAAKPLARPLLLPVFPRIFLIGFTFCQPFLINGLLEYLAHDGENGSQHDEAGLVGATILVYLGIAISTSLYWYYQERSQSLLRAFLVTSIYQKATQAPSSENKAAITLMSTDVDRIYTGVRFVHEIWANIIQIALSAWHLYRVIGLSFLAPLILVAFAFTTSIVLSKYATKYQRNWMKFVEKRIGVTSYALSHLKEYRISGMTSPVQNLVQKERVEEIRQGGKSRGIIGISATTSYIPQALAPVLTFAFGSKVIDSTKAFTTLSFLSLLASPLMLVLQVIPILSACFACLRRIHEFTLTPNRHDPRLAKGKLVTSLDEKSSRKETSLDAAVILSGTIFGWVAETPVLKGIHVSIERSSFTFVIGTVASGKSTLCKGILGEVPFCTGQIMVDAAADKIGYCDQSPFLMNATVMENIVGNSSFDSRRYNDVISATMLEEDLKTFPQKDQTKIGSKGVSLSGGQRQRISLARALYHDAELLILDDIFTGLDEKTSQQICWRVFGPEGLLRSRRTTVVLCTQATQFLFVADQIVELSSDGTVSKQGVAENFIIETAYPQNYEVLRLGQKKEDTDDVLQGSPLEEDPTATKDTAAVNVRSTPASKTDTSLYLHYMSSIGWPLVVIFLTVTASTGFFFNFPAIWLKIWSADSVKDIPNHSFAFYIRIFVLVAVLGVFVVFAMGLINLQTFVRLSGTHHHEQVLQTAMHSSLRFLTTTDTGKILNLFSQDMTIIDSQLPRMVNNFLNTLASSLGQAIIVALSSGYLAVSYPFFILILFALQKVYLPTSKQLRILDLEAKSPLFTHFLDTQDGITTFRAFGWIPDQISRNKDLLNSSQRPSYLLAMAQQWLLLAMNIIVAILAIILVSLATNLKDINSGSVGAGLVMLMGLGASMTAEINSYTGLEIALGGINRLKTFGETTEGEDKPGEDAVPAVEWPSNGNIAISDVAASYMNDPNALVLSEVALNIKSGEKVAVCGRTGSGKSSLISLILRMIDPLSPHGSQPPSVTIDGTHLKNINRTVLRERIIALSQDAVFLPEGSSFKANLDPWNEASREEAMDALAVVGLLDVLQDRGGLNALAKNAELSAGQKQMFALGRAILRRRIRARKMSEKEMPEGGVLLLDEVTASVDKETESRMLELVWREFEAYTILMVTHSIQAAVRCDRVIIMEKGKIVEDDESGALIQEGGSKFQALAGSLADN